MLHFLPSRGCSISYLRGVFPIAHPVNFPSGPSYVHKMEQKNSLAVPPQTFAAAQFVDATYEGALMKMAGVAYTWGREGSDEYNESVAGDKEQRGVCGIFASSSGTCIVSVRTPST